MEDFTDHVTHLNTVNYAPQVWDQKDIKVWIPLSCVLTLTRYGKTGKKNKRATCFATLLQNRPSPYDSSTRPMSFRSRGSGCGSIMHWPRRPGKSRTGTRQIKLPCAFYNPRSNLPCNKSGFCKLWNTDFWLVKITWEWRHTRDLRHSLENKFALGR